MSVAWLGASVPSCLRQKLGKNPLDPSFSLLGVGTRLRVETERVERDRRDELCNSENCSRVLRPCRRLRGAASRRLRQSTCSGWEWRRLRKRNRDCDVARRLPSLQECFRLLLKAEERVFKGAPLASSGDAGSEACLEVIAGDGGLAGMCFGSVSRRTPSKSVPSLRQLLAILAENCSLCHFTMSLDPTEMGLLSRMQAPDGDVSSSVAGARLGFPVGSSQETSATAHKTVLRSMFRPSLSSVSA